MNRNLSYDSDHDGMPSSWELSHGLDPNNPSDASAQAQSGYTWIEEYVNSLIPMPGVTLTATPTPNRIFKRVFSSSDDAEQNTANGSMDLTSIDLDLFSTVNGDVIVGLRFGNVTIPHRAVINEAYLEITASGIGSNATNVEIFGQDSDTVTTFLTSNWNLSSEVRPKTNASISWAIPGFTQVGQLAISPDLSSVIQEVVDRVGWQSGNSIALILRGTGNRVVKSYDGDPANAPRLVITYR